MSPSGGYRPLLQCEVWRERDRFLASQEGGEEDEEEREGGGEMAEAGTAILSLHYWSSSSTDQRPDCLLRCKD